MKKALGALVLASALSITSACAELDDGGTAADRAEVNNKSKGEKSAKTKKKSSEPKESRAQENARKSAEDYLDLTAYSRKGLIEQLEFEGYSTKDATYGVDAQKANWKKQAALAAENYLDLTSYSRDGLIDQLMFEGYTREQAEHGVNQAGL